MKKHIPNMITSLNLASGFIAAVFIVKGDIVSASWMITLAMVFDFLDGFASRLLNAYSDLGKELDSLADVISFGLIPGMIIYMLLSVSLESASFIKSHDNLLTIILTALIPSFFAVCAGLRLAKFNIDTTQTSSFRGLPTPAAALAVISIVLSSAYSEWDIIKTLISSPVFITIFSLILSALMISRIPLLSFKFKTWGWKSNEGRYILMALSVILVAAFQWGGLALIIPSYIIVSLIPGIEI